MEEAIYCVLKAFKLSLCQITLWVFSLLLASPIKVLSIAQPCAKLQSQYILGCEHQNEIPVT